MAIGLDPTAHPTDASNLFTGQNGGVNTVIVSPTFSTGAGPILLVAIVAGELGSAPTAWSVDSTSHLDWELDVDKTSLTQEAGAADFFGAQIWTAFSSTGSLSTQAVTATLNAVTTGRKATLWVLVLNGVGSTHAACIGNSAGFVDGSSAGVNQQISTSLTPAASGSWIVLGLGQTNDSAVLTANSNTSAYDNTFQPSAFGDYFGFGRYKASGTVATTTAASAVTVGSSVSDLWGYIAALEIKAASLGAIFVEDDTFVPARMMSFAPVPAPQWNMGEQEIVPQPAALAFEEDRLEQVRMQPLARVPAVAQDNEDAPALFAPWIDGDYAALALMPPAQTWRQTPPVREDDFVPTPATGPFEDDFWTLPIRQAAPVIRGIAPSDEDMPPTAPATLQPDEDFWANMVKPLAGTPWRDPVQRNNEDTPAGLHGPFEEDRWTSGVAPVVGTPWRNPAFIADEDYIRFIASVPNLANLKLLSVGQAGVKLTESASATARLGLTNSASLKLVRKLT